ncbi:MAG: serine/threonine protein kinase [Bacteroidales bacterium]|nr:serine/threonine protein kinase [Bacteroidales bacterium]
MSNTVIIQADEGSEKSRKTILSDLSGTLKTYGNESSVSSDTPIPYENLLWDERYHLIKCLGNGATSQVWKALDTKADNIEVAVKIFSAIGLADEQGRRLFVKEFTGVHQLSHPNLLTPSSYDICKNVPYLISKYCEKGSVLPLIGKMTEREVLKLIKCTAEGLNYLHRHNIVHQDIKPDNVLIDNEDNYVLTDFGITGQADKEIKGGTPAYMAPEFFNGQKRIATVQTDIWAFGASVFELITGDVPFGEDGGKAQMRGAKVPVLPKIFKNRTIRRIVYRCLDVNPQNRPSAEDILQELSDMNNRKKQLWLIPAIAAGVAAIVIGVYYLFFYKDPDLKLAERKLSKYKQLIEDCRTLSTDTLDNGRTENLLNAKLKLKEIKDLEERFSKFLPNDYNKYSEFENLDMVFKNESLKNAQRAIRQNDRALIKPFLQIANDFYHSNGIEKAIQLTENGSSSDMEIKNAIEQGINELK